MGPLVVNCWCIVSKPKVPADLQVWIEVRRRHRLSDAQVQMARELGLNPKKIGSLDNHRQEPWKAPLPDFIATMYERRFGRRQPERVVTIEQRATELAEKKASRRARRAGEPTGESRLRVDTGGSEHQSLGPGAHTTLPFMSDIRGPTTKSSGLARQRSDMSEPDSTVAERIRTRVDAELPLLADRLRRWLVAHRATPREIKASIDPEGSQQVWVWLVTDHTGAEDSSSRVVYEPGTDAFGITIDLQNGVSWFKGADDSLAAAVENM